MFRNRHFSEDRRSKLFHELPDIWGRMAKFCVFWVVSMNVWGGYYVYHKSALAMHLQDETKRAYRRTLPFIQAMEDVRYCAVQERNYMILKAVCDYSDPRAFEFFRSRYNQEDHFLSYYRGTSMRNHYDGRYGSGRYMHMKAQRTPEDNRGLVGAQEVSMYG